MLYDYELTNRDLLPALKPVFEHFRAAGGDPRLLEPIRGVDAKYLHACFDELRRKFGSVVSCVAQGLGIEPRGPAATARRARRAVKQHRRP